VDARVEAAIWAARDATERVSAVVADLTDDDARGPSRLPGWSRGHVLTHLARNADGIRNMVEGAAIGERRAMYPGGSDRRAADIDAGAGRAAAELLEDFAETRAALDAAWDAMPDDAWEVPGDTIQGPVPMRRTNWSRRRELLVHLVDLDLGVAPADLPDDFLTGDAEWLRDNRGFETWPDAPWARLQ
jgi:maleylpyruvate isomerase